MSSLTKVLFYGASGHGKVVADIVRTSEQAEIVGFVDDDPSRVGQMLGGFEVVGTAEALPALLRSGISTAIVTIGSNTLRTRKAAQLKKAGFKLATAIHARAVVAEGVKVGCGTVIMAGAVVNPGARIGCNVIINTGATVDHDCTIEDGVHISPGAHLAGTVHVGSHTHIGIGASVIQNIRIGAHSIIGAGAAVIRDVPANVTVAGVPVRVIRG